MYFPSSPGKLEAESQGSPPHKPPCLGVSYFRDINQPGRLSHWRHWATCRFREGWKSLISVVHRPLRKQKSWEPEKPRHPGLQSRELPGGFGARDPGKAKDRQARSLNWNHQFTQKVLVGKSLFLNWGHGLDAAVCQLKLGQHRAAVTPAGTPWAQMAGSMLASSYIASPTKDVVLHLLWRSMHILLR